MAIEDDAIHSLTIESDYEALAIFLLKAGSHMPSGEYKQALTAQAQVLATLHQARMAVRATVIRLPEREPAPVSHAEGMM